MVNKLILLGGLLIMLFCNHSCNKERFPYDEEGLTYKGQLDFNGEIRLDGVYLSYSEEEENTLSFFFWQNGIVNRGGSKGIIEESSFMCDIIGVKIEEDTREIPYFWGYFIIEGDELKLQTYDPVSRNRYPEFRVEERLATIINDTTLHFYQRIRPSGEVVEMDRTYHFHHCINKPDSTNILMGE